MAATDDIEILKEHDRHITKQELENIIYDRLGYLAIGGFRLKSELFEIILSKNLSASEKNYLNLRIWRR